MGGASREIYSSELYPLGGKHCLEEGWLEASAWRLDVHRFPENRAQTSVSSQGCMAQSTVPRVGPWLMSAVDITRRNSVTWCKIPEGDQSEVDN